MQNRGRLPETDDEAREDIRDHFPREQAAQYIQTYEHHRAKGLAPSAAALKTMTGALNDGRKQIAGLLGRN
jgi:hypothetical protein